MTGSASSLNDLIRTALEAHVPALHLIRAAEGIRLYARTTAGLTPFGPREGDPAWFDHAVALPFAETLDDRVVIDLAAQRPRAEGLAGLGMPNAMRAALDRECAIPGGVILVAATDPELRQRVMRAIADDAGERHIAEIGEDRVRLDIAARMDCDAILVAASDDRSLLTAALDHAQRGRRIIIGVDAADTMGALARLRGLRVERHLLAFALRALIAAHAAAGLCTACRRPVQARGSDSALLGVDPGTVVYEPVGCGVCAGSGYGTPVILFEGVAADTGLRRLFAEGGDAAILARHAFVRAPTLAGSARLLAREGRITVETAIAVTRSSATGSFIPAAHPHLLTA